MLGGMYYGTIMEVDPRRLLDGDTCLIKIEKDENGVPGWVGLGVWVGHEGLEQVQSSSAK